MKGKGLIYFCGIMIAIGCIFFGLGLALGGNLYGIALTEKGIVVDTDKESDTESDTAYSKESGNDRFEKFELEEFDSIDVEINFSQLRIINSDHYGVEYRVPGNTNPKIEVKNGKLYVKANTLDKGQFRVDLFSLPKGKKLDELSPVVYIYVPSGMEGKELDINLSSGKLVLDDLTFDEMEIKSSFGDFEFGTLKFGEFEANVSSGSIRGDELIGREAELSMSFGDARLKKLEADDLEVKMSSGNIEVGEISGEKSFVNCSYGSIKIDKLLSENAEVKNSSGEVNINETSSEDIDVNCSFGEINLGLDNIESYNMDCKADFGEVVIGGNKKGSTYYVSDSGKPKSLSAKCSSGEVNVK